MNNNLGLGIFIGGIATFFAGKYLLSDEGATKANNALEKVKTNEELKQRGVEMLINQITKYR